MINKKINRLLSSVLGVALTIGIVQMPAFAADNVQAASSYSVNASLTESKNCIVSKGKSVEKNGLKISIDNVAASKHKLKVAVLVESQKPFDKDKEKGEFADVILTYGNNKMHSQSESVENKDDKTYEINIERDIDNEVFPEKGSLRIDIVIPQYKVNVGIETDVDLSEAFKESVEKEVSIKVPETDFTINKFESNLLGTEITYSKPEKDSSSKRIGLSDHESSKLILKTGDKMYPFRQRGIHSSGNGKDDNIMIGSYETEGVTYDKVKNQGDISVIPVTCSITNEEMEQIYKDSNKNKEKDDADKETINNVEYPKNIDFSDGSKGEIYNVERNDNSLKIHCKGDSDKESLLMASTMSIYYKVEEGKEDDDYYRGNKYVSFYKDPKDSLGYIVEFNDVKKDKTVELNYNSLIKQIDKYEIGNEVKIFN